VLVRLAVRNLSRNLRRTLLSLGSVIAGVAVIILGQGFVGGLEENTIRAQVDTMSAHLSIRPADYPTEGLTHPVDALVPVDAGLTAALDSSGGKWTTRTLFAPRAVHRGDSIRARAISYDPVRDPQVFPREMWNVAGEIPTDEGVLISRGVARLLELNIGDVFVLQVRTHKGAVNALEVPVAGVVSVGSPIVDRFGILLPRKVGNALLGIDDGLVSHVHLRFPNRNRSTAAEDLTPALPRASEMVTWQDETRAMLQMHQIRRTALNILAFALLLMSAAGIANTILMAAYERVREIGTLRAMGMTRRTVVSLFVLEGGLMGAAGSVLGALIGGAVVLYFNINGIDLSVALENASGGNVPVSTMLYLEFSQLVIAFAMVFGLAVAVMASIYPALVASNMAPADAVRA